MMAIATVRTHNCDECGQSHELNEDDTPYCESCLNKAEAELDAANKRVRLTDRDGKLIETIYRSKKARRPAVKGVNRSREAERRRKQMERKAAKAAKRT